MKKMLSIFLVMVFVMSLNAYAFASTTENKEFMELYGITVIDEYTISIGDTVWDIKELAHDNDVDPDELKAALLSGPDADGRLSPFANLRELGNKSLEEKIADTNSRSTKNKNFGKYSSDPTRATYTTHYNQDSTAYVWTGNPMANGKYPEVKHIASKRLSGGSPTIPFGKHVATSQWIQIPGYPQRCDFWSGDTGNGPSNPTSHWIDIYFGGETNYQTAYNAAINYGRQKINIDVEN